MSLGYTGAYFSSTCVASQIDNLRKLPPATVAAVVDAYCERAAANKMPLLRQVPFPTTRTEPKPEATLNVKELSETQVDRSGADPRSLVLGEVLIPKNLPYTEMLLLPDEGTELATQTLETSGAV